MLWKKYYQKSQVFLFPVLGFKKNITIKPTGTFISWKGKYKPEDRKLIVVYKQSNNEGFKAFEQRVIFANKLFEDFFECEHNHVVYVFTFEEFKEDWDNFLKGKYSRMSKTLKDRVQSYFGKESKEWEIIQTFLDPVRFQERYAAAQTDNVYDYNNFLKLLIEVGELADKYAPDLETLMIPVVSDSKTK